MLRLNQGRGLRLTHQDVQSGYPRGLQKWIFDSGKGQWDLAYTLQAGLQLGRWLPHRQQFCNRTPLSRTPEQVHRALQEAVREQPHRSLSEIARRLNYKGAEGLYQVDRALSKPIAASY